MWFMVEASLTGKMGRQPHHGPRLLQGPLREKGFCLVALGGVLPFLQS